MSAPRLLVLTATDSHHAVVLRRGPSHRAASWGWNRATGAITFGQWLDGRIFPFRSDLAPDGAHLVYLVDGGATGYRTVVSRAPYLHAIAQVAQTDGWHGGGAFTADGALWLNGTGPLSDAPRELRITDDPMAYPTSTDGFHMGELQVAKLVRRGWVHVSGTGYDAVLTRDLAGSWRLRQRFALGAEGRAQIAARYELVDPSGAARPQPDWDWAEPWGDGLHVTAGGHIWQMEAPDAAPVALHDLGGPLPPPVRAPYDDRPEVPR
ncbi:hypothetical protein [uncultured Jannaschia sp.]|uniref:hypothetical protein n=1 Tax=uncultured Jannaschia sp. TaxID=293347 RepID=UPI002609B1FE|nr:hypothetical protein [uncultured Jannaschia sp.]